MRRTIVFVVVGLVVASCSSVSEEDHEAALAEAVQLQEQVSGLESTVDEVEGQLATTETELATTQDEVVGLEDDLVVAEEDASRAVERYEELTDLSAIPNTSAATLIFVLSRETLLCGVAGTFPGFSQTQLDGSTTGFDADFCRAVAAAVLGDADDVEFVPVTAAERFNAVRFGGVDVLFRNTTWTLNRDAALGQQVDFGPTTFYDGQQLMGTADQYEITSTGADVDGARVCVNENTASADRVVEYAASFGTAVEIVNSATNLDLLLNGTCDLITTDGSGLAIARETAIQAGEIAAGDLVIFPSTPISREPLGPVYRQGDTVWADIINWVIYTTIIAAEKGISSSNIDTIEWDAEAQRLFGTEGEHAVTLGLDLDAFYQVIKQVGNYTEIFDRNLNDFGFVATGSANTVYTQGGLLYAPPVR